MESITNMKLPDCSICSQPFTLNGYLSNKSVRIPLLLHCAHPACENCIISNLRMKNFITCLICKKVSSVLSSSEDSDILSQFPIDNTLCGMCFNKSNSVSIQSDTQIGFIKPVLKNKKDTTKSMLCNECQDYRSEVLCKQCSAPYCNSCFKKVHSAARALRDHAATSLHEDESELNDDFDTTSCKEHTTHALEFFCDQCDVTICSFCLLASHNGHKVHILKEKNQEFRNGVIESYVRVSNIQRRLKASKKEVRHMLCSSKKKDSTCVETQVTNFFLKLHGLVSLLQNKITNQIKAAQSTASLNDVMTQLNSYIDETDRVLYRTKRTLGETEMANVNYKKILTLLQSKEKIPCFVLKDMAEDSIIFNCDPKAFDDLESYCSVVVKQKSEYKLVTENELPEDFIPEDLDMISAADVESTLSIKPAETPSAKSEDLLSIKSKKGSLKASSDSSSVKSGNSICGSLTDVPLSLNNDELVPGCTVQVTISHLISPSDFYVHRMTIGKKITELQNILRKRGLGKLQRVSSQSIVKGAVFMVFYDYECSWYRARITEVLNNREVKVHYIDYGNSEVINRDRLLSSPHNVRCIPPLALRCRLANCQPLNGESWDPQVVTVMTQITNSCNDPVLITVVEKTHQFYEVDMIRNGDLYSFNVADTLLFLNLAYASNMPKRFPTVTVSGNNLRTMPPRNTIKQGSILDASMAHIVDPGHFYLIVKQGPVTGRKLVELQNDLQKSYNKHNANSQVMFDPKPGIYVAAKCSNDKRWYRAEVLSIPDSKMVKVFYIDIGYTEVLNWKNIKILFSKFYKLPPQAYRCCLADIDPLGSIDWNEQSAGIFRKETASAKLKAMVDTVNEDAVSVVLYKTGNEADVCLNALLVREKLAISTGVNSTVVEFPKLYEMPKNDNTFQCDVSIENQLKKLMKKPEVQLVVPNTHNFFVKAPNGCLKIQVSIKRIVDPGEFYITLCYVEDEFKTTERNLQEFYNNNDSLSETTNWNVDNRCAVQLDNKWFRAIILEILSEGQFKIYIPDEGITEIVDSTSLRPLDEKFLSQRDGVSKCYLGGLIPSLENWSKTSITEFEEFAKTNAGNLYITKMSQSEMKGNSLPVELFKRSVIPAGPLESAKDNWTSFNHYLRMIGLAKSDAVTKWDVDGNIITDEKTEENGIESEAKLLQDILSSTFKSFKKVQSPEPTVLDTNDVAVKWLTPEPVTALEYIGTPTYIDDDCKIYIQDFMKSTLALPQICEDLTKRFEKTLPTPYDLNWTPGDICAAQYYVDKRWYRGLVTKVLNEEVTLVQFVDYGNVDPCGLGTLRKKPSMTHVPVQATCFKLHTIAPVHADNCWKREELDNIHRFVSTKNCRVELEIIAGGYGVKRLIMANGQDAISAWVANKWARWANEPLVDYLMRQQNDLQVETDKQQSEEEVFREEENESEEEEDEEEEAEDGDEVEPEDDVENSEIAEYEEGASVQPEGTSEEEICLSNEDKKYNDDKQIDPLNVLLHWSCIVFRDDLAKLNCKYEQLELSEDTESLSVEVGAVLSGTELVLSIINPDNDILLKSKNQFNEVLATMQTEASKLPLLEKPYKYKMCSAQFTADQTWYRGFVLDELSNDTMLIQYIDYGNVEILSVDKVHTIADEWVVPKAQSILCRLQNISVDKNLALKEVMNNVSTCLSQGVLQAKIKDRSLVNTVELYIDNKLAYQPLIDEGVFQTLVEIKEEPDQEESIE